MDSINNSSGETAKTTGAGGLMRQKTISEYISSQSPRVTGNKPTLSIDTGKKKLKTQDTMAARADFDNDDDCNDCDENN